jgi:hypothetical protein
MYNNNKLCYHPLIPQSSALKLYKQINRLYFKIISLRPYLYNLILDHFLKNDFSEFLNGISDLHSKKIFPEIKNYSWE